jgi:hypothetical protein
MMSAAHMRRLLAAAGVLAALIAIAWATSRPLPPIALTPPGSFAFAALGDAPYDPFEDVRYPFVLDDLEAHDLAFVVHVGDIFWRPCSDARYRRSLDWFNGLRHPVIYTPGDNEWADCWEPGSGRFGPRDRLGRIRELFFREHTQSLGGRRIALASQADREPFAEFRENARWIYDSVVFATVHLIGSDNGLKRFAGQTPDDVAAVARRTEAATSWMRETFAEAQRADAPAVVIAFHADPELQEAPGDAERRPFEAWITALEEEVERFARPVLAIHGDSHEFIVDRPLVRRTTGQRLDHLIRVVVPGSPAMGWARVVVTPGAPVPFAIAPRVIPRWKFW